ncbi:MAG: histidinol-phosphate aminotransferase [Candidatus Azotimanducaceae bacterium]|jgi:histidinol-phosphate aminotransferase
MQTNKTDFISLASSGIKELQPYQAGKPVDELQRELGISDIVKLASNENPFGPSEKVVAALTTVMPELSRYPDGSAYSLKKKLASFLDVDTNMLTIGNGSNDVLELLARVYLRPGMEAIVSQHSFVVYPLAIKSLGADLRVIPAKNYAQDLEATLSAVTENTRMIFIANPNNPTGTWIGRVELTSFMERLRGDIIVVLDEAYFEYVQEAEYPDGIAMHKQFSNIVVTRTFSKSYGLASLRVGYSVSHADVADLLNRVRQPFNVNAMSLAAAIVAIDDQEHVKAAIDNNNQGMSYLTEACDKLGLTYIPSVGNFLTIDFARDAMPIYEALLREGVIVRPIGVYEMPNHLRVTIGLPSENERFVNSLVKVLG